MEIVFQNSENTAFLAIGDFPNPELLEQCITDIDELLEETPEIKVYGKVCKQHRNIGFFSDISIGYRYSNKLMTSKPLTNTLAELLSYINTAFHAEYNGILVNKYIDGNNYIGAHSDDETCLDKSGVVGISYGTERIFRIRDKTTKQIVYNVQTPRCGIIHMGGDFQKIYTHEIPIQKKIKTQRISFTFRKHLI